MKVGQAASTPRGSFGIPPEMDPDKIREKIEAQKRTEERAAAPQGPAMQVDEYDAIGDGFEEDTPVTAEEKDSPVKAALKNLEAIGVTMSPEDWSNLFFKGFIEKTINVADIPDFAKKTSRPFLITVRTLTADESDVADTLLAQDTKMVDMTSDGFNNRKQLWSFSCALQKINGMAVCKPKFKEDATSKERTLDIHETIKEKRRIIGNMSPTVLSLAIRKYWQFVNNIEVILSEKDGYFLEKP